MKPAIFKGAGRWATNKRHKQKTLKSVHKALSYMFFIYKQGLQLWSGPQPKWGGQLHLANLALGRGPRRGRSFR